MNRRITTLSIAAASLIALAGYAVEQQQTLAKQASAGVVGGTIIMPNGTYYVGYMDLAEGQTLQSEDAAMRGVSAP